MTNLESHTQSLPALHRVLVVGNGGRENALAWALKRCKGIETVWVTPGNGGTEDHHGCIRLKIEETHLEALIETCSLHRIELVVIGPEAPLAAGIADGLRKAGLAVFGPGKKGAQLEASKAWSKNLMEEANIPTAKHWTVTSEAEALSILENLQKPLVVKANGLAAGKGVTVAQTVDETKHAIKQAFQGKFGTAGEQLVLEEVLEGPEVSIFALCDGKDFVLLPTAQDHKRLREGDQGPNTGGMGAYAPAPHLNNKDLEEVKALIIKPTLKALNAIGIDYRGVIYAGLMLTKSGPQVIEFNCRFGDPECQALMPLMGPELAEVLHACALGCLGKAGKLSFLENYSACVVAAASGYPDNPRKGDQIEVNIKSNESLQLFQAGTKCNTKGQLITSGGRVLAVVAKAENFEDAFNQAYEGLKKVNFEGMTFRRDIGHQVRKS